MLQLLLGFHRDSELDQKRRNIQSDHVDRLLDLEGGYHASVIECPKSLEELDRGIRDVGDGMF